jgi:hypothetical protein
MHRLKLAEEFGPTGMAGAGSHRRSEFLFSKTAILDLIRCRLGARSKLIVVRIWEHTFEALTGGRSPLPDQDPPNRAAAVHPESPTADHS